MLTSDYFQHTLLSQIEKASKVHKRLKANTLQSKVFDHGDLVSTVYLKAYDKAIKLGRPLDDKEVKYLCRRAGFQAYREHLAMFRSQYTLAELEDMGHLVGFPVPSEVSQELTEEQVAIRRLLGLTLEPDEGSAN